MTQKIQENVVCKGSSLNGKFFSNINLRNILRQINEHDRLSHKIHRYPAKMIHHIPYLFVNDDSICSEGDTVLDVFCGSGTVLVESMVAGRNCIGADLNPLCCLISKVKTTPLNRESLDTAVERLLKKLEAKRNLLTAKFSNIDYWFTKNAQRSLTHIKCSIEECEFDPELRDFFLVSFSSIIRGSSRADPRIGPPVLSKEMKKAIAEGRRVYPMKLFKEAVRNNRSRILEFSSKCSKKANAHVLFQDAKKLAMRNQSVDLVITSPPYMNAQKYFRSTKLELFWLGLISEERFAELDSHAVGTDRIRKSDYPMPTETGIPEVDSVVEDVFVEKPLRALVVSKYFIDLDHVIKEVHRVLKINRYFALIIGNNEVRKSRFPSHKVAIEIAKKYGFSLHLALVDRIKSHGLMTKRNKTSGLIGSEWILLFRKES